MAKRLKTRAKAEAAPAIGETELIWLLGQPPLTDYLSFVETKVMDGAAQDARALVAEWRAANDVYHALEQDEAGLADTISYTALPKALRKRAAAVETLPWFRSSFDNLPYQFVEVELDKLIVSQPHVERGTMHAMVERLGGDAKPAAVFDLCVPRERVLPQVTARRLSSNRYSFTSPSTDFRAHTPRLVLAEGNEIDAAAGPLFATLGIGVGFGSNVLSGIRSGTRILLQNGHHRAYALRSLGYRTCYAVVEDVTRKDELRLTATQEVIDDPEFYFAAPRPPLLKDFFDPRLAKTLRVKRIDNEVEIELLIRSHNATHVGS